LIAVIGRHWLTAADVKGRRRLDSPKDFVRLEIAAALDRKIRVIPALVAGAHMPRTEDLPHALAKLTRRNALTIDAGGFDQKVTWLIETLEKSIAERAQDETLLEKRGVAIDWSPCVRLARTEQEVRIIGRLDEKQYGSQSIDTKALVDWWRIYPNGVYLFVKYNIVGALGIWPVDERVFSRLCNGEAEETSIKSENIRRPHACPSHNGISLTSLSTRIVPSRKAKVSCLGCRRSSAGLVAITCLRMTT
jgi:hypothetical protein